MAAWRPLCCALATVSISRLSSERMQHLATIDEQACKQPGFLMEARRLGVWSTYVTALGKACLSVCAVADAYYALHWMPSV